MSRLITIIFFAGLCSCTSLPIHELPSIRIENTEFFAPYCIYNLEDSSLNIKQLKSLITEFLPDYEFVDSLSSDTPSPNKYIIESFDNPAKQYPAPDIPYLDHSSHNLSELEKKQLQSPANAILIVFTGSNQDIIEDNISINLIISSLLKNTSSIVTDYTTYESFNSESWDSDRVASWQQKNLDITSQFTIHLYREKEYCRAVTLGMGKFCLPDISIPNISCNNQNSYASLINLVCQTLIEHYSIREDSSLLVDITKIDNDHVRNQLSQSLFKNAAKKSLIQLATVPLQEGDAYNTQLEIVFDNKEYSSPQEEQQALITQLFGSTDKIDYVSHDKKILQASKAAKAKLPELKNQFQNGLEPGYSILLKGPFETDTGGREWMWVEVTSWNENHVKGILQNDPFEISSLKAGALVSIDLENVFDYILYFPDGTIEGNETGKIISNSN